METVQPDAMLSTFALNVPPFPMVNCAVPPRFMFAEVPMSNVAPEPTVNAPLICIHAMPPDWTKRPPFRVSEPPSPIARSPPATYSHVPALMTTASPESGTPSGLQQLAVCHVPLSPDHVFVSADRSNTCATAATATIADLTAVFTFICVPSVFVFG